MSVPDIKPSRVVFAVIEILVGRPQSSIYLNNPIVIKELRVRFFFLRAR